jgi:hypothetical protein
MKFDVKVIEYIVSTDSHYEKDRKPNLEDLVHGLDILTR